jgi:outer membrane protein TolC
VPYCRARCGYCDFNTYVPARLGAVAAPARFVAAAQSEIALAGRVRDSMMYSYLRGGRPLIDVLDSERSYRETRRRYITSRADYWRAMYLYNSVVGVNSSNDFQAIAYQSGVPTY